MSDLNIQGLSATSHRICMDIIYKKIKINMDDIHKILEKYNFSVWNYDIYDIEGIKNKLNNITSNKKGTGFFEEIMKIFNKFVNINNKKEFMFANVLL